jgi:hypothetical protein
LTFLKIKIRFSHWGLLRKNLRTEPRFDKCGPDKASPLLSQCDAPFQALRFLSFGLAYLMPQRTAAAFPALAPNSNPNPNRLAARA